MSMLAMASCAGELSSMIPTVSTPFTLVCKYNALNVMVRTGRVDATTGIIYTVAGNYYLDRIYQVLPYSGDGGPATNAALHRPWGIAVDAAGNLFIADAGNNVIRKVAA